jgi:hypothetical protein
MKYNEMTWGQMEAVINKLGGMDGVRRFLSGEATIVAVAKRLLKFLDTVIVLATTERFITSDKFVVDTGKKARVKISYLGDNFRNWFFSKIDEPANEVILRYGKLMESSTDGPILAELSDTAESTLPIVYALMERQSNGEDGALLINGYANIFYVRDVSDVLRAVSVRWFGRGWDVNAYSVESPYAWHGSPRVFSRNS